MKLRYDAIFFDLDNTIAPARGIGLNQFQPAFEAVLAAVQVDWHPDDQALALQRAFDECWHTAFNEVARKYRFTEPMFTAGNEAFSKIVVSNESNYRTYDDANLIEDIAAHIPCYLITSGYPLLQNSKVDCLKIRAWFSEFLIDAADTMYPTGKEALFRELVLRCAIKESNRVLVVGDNPASEIRAGNALGMDTVQVLRPGVLQSEDADFVVENFYELLPLLGMNPNFRIYKNHAGRVA